MIDESNFIVRLSGRIEKSYYIDYSGAYRITEISKVVNANPASVKEIYLSNGAYFDESMDIYYFNSVDSAKKTITDILKSVKLLQRGKLIFLTDAEIEYIRKALINEEVNSLHISKSVKDDIFKKLNGHV